MTLIAAFRASKSATGPDGIVVCADSQETVTKIDAYGQPYDLRLTVQKIEPIYSSPAIHISIAGSGNALLIEGFIEKAKREFGKGADPSSLVAVRDLLEKRLARFYKNEVANSPDDKQFKLFIMASCPQTQEYDLWISENSVLRSPKFPSLIGWEHELYVNTATRLSSADLTLSQAVLASIYTLTVAKQTSNYVGGELSVAIIRSSGIWQERADYIAEMEARLKTYESKVTQLFLDCADISVSTAALITSVQQFGTEAVKLHREQIDAHLQSKTLAEIANTNEPYSKIPLGTHIMFGSDGKFLEVGHDPDRVPIYDQHAKMANEHFSKMGLVEYVIKRIDENKFSIALSKRWTGGEHLPLEEMNREQFIASMSEAQPFSGEQILAFLEIDGSEIFVYAEPPKPSGS